jgi:hypothetical protein
VKPISTDALNTVRTAGAGAAVGAGLHVIVGSVGVAAGGAALGLTMGPFIAIGAGVGAAGYGLYWLGKQVATRSKAPDPLDVAQRALHEDGPPS